MNTETVYKIVTSQVFNSDNGGNWYDSFIKYRRNEALAMKHATIDQGLSALARSSSSFGEYVKLLSLFKQSSNFQVASRLQQVLDVVIAR